MTLSPPLEQRVNQDVLAYGRGPAALDTRVDNLPAAEVLSRYKHLVGLVGIQKALRSRDARLSSVRAQVADERRQVASGGNR